MKTTIMAIASLVTLAAPLAAAQGGQAPSPPGAESQSDQEPPAQAYADCRGKEVGDVVAHSSLDGLVAALCADSPQGLVARPVKRPEEKEDREQESYPSPDTQIAGNLVVTSSAADQAGMLSVEYTCDGDGSSPALSWTSAPLGTKELAVMMTTMPPGGRPKWNWVVYGIPATTTELAKNSVAIGTQGVGSNGSAAGYEPPCSRGPGLKTYTVTVYALSAHPALKAMAGASGADLARAIAGITLDSGTFDFHYDRPGVPPQKGFEDRRLPKPEH